MSLDDAIAKVRELPVVAKTNGSGPAAEADAAFKRHERPLTDLGNAEQFVRDHGTCVLYCAAWERSGPWLVWDGARWRPDTMNQALALMSETMRGIWPDEERRKAIGKWAARSESRQARTAALALAAPMVAVHPDELDADPWLLNCANGTVDLRTGDLRPHDPADRITRLVAADWNPEAPAPRWLTFIERVQPDPELRAYIQRKLGTALVGRPLTRELTIFHGVGDNGKTVVFEVGKGVLGEYALEVPPHLLLHKRETGGPTPDLASLEGRRLVITAETQGGQRLNEAGIKE